MQRFPRFNRPGLRGNASSALLGYVDGDGSTLSLNLTTGVLDPRLTFTRASDATFINSSGLVQWADANHVQNSTMLNNTGTRWTQTTSGGTVTINGDGTVRFNGTGGRAIWLQTVGSLASGLPMTFSFRVTSFTNTNLRTTDFFNAGTGFTGQSYFYTDTTGTTHTLTAFESLPKSGTNGVGTYSVTATTNATSANIVFGSDCNGVGGRSGDVTITEPQLQYGTVVLRSVYVPNSSIIAAKWDSPRFDYDPTTPAPLGLLIEGSATNLLNYSESFRTTPVAAEQVWADSASISRGFETGPDGVSNSSVTFVATGVSGNVTASNAVGTAAVRTLSFWARRTGGGTVEYTVDNGASWNSQAITQTWTRYSFVLSSASQRVGFRIATGAGTAIWGAQLEAGSGASSYIPTGASTVQRLADNCSIVSPNFAPWFNASAGTLLVSARTATRYVDAAGFDFPAVLTLDSNNHIGPCQWNGVVYGVVRAGGSYRINYATLASPGNNANYKAAIAYADSDYAGVANGGSIQTGSGTTVPSGLNQLALGASRSGVAGNFFGHISQIKFWPTRLPNAQLQSLTT